MAHALATAPPPVTVNRRVTAIIAAIVLLATATILANRVLPGWAYPLSGLATAVTLLGLARWSGLRLGHVGFDRRHLRRAALVGLTGLALVGLGFGIAMAVPSLRVVFDDGRMGTLGLGALLWVTLIRIPLGTVLLEEVAFRGVLPALFGGGERWRWGPVLAASALFGLWHVLPSLALTQNAAVGAVFGGVPIAVISIVAVLASAVAGIVLYWWRHAGRGLIAPMLVHIATNSGGVIAAWWLLSAG